MPAKLQLCPCHSGLPYETCCRPFHRGLPAPNALQLMRSRYAAYALHLTTYIIATTHPKSPHFLQNLHLWKTKIAQFTRKTTFRHLEILNFAEEQERATVTFIAHLEQGGKDASFQEKSLFEKLNGRWLYIDKL